MPQLWIILFLTHSQCNYPEGKSKAAGWSSTLISTLVVMLEHIRNGGSFWSRSLGSLCWSACGLMSYLQYVMPGLPLAAPSTLNLIERVKVFFHFSFTLTFCNWSSKMEFQSWSMSIWEKPKSSLLLLTQLMSLILANSKDSWDNLYLLSNNLKLCCS